MLLVSSAVFFFKINLFKKSFWNLSCRVANGLDPDQDRRSVGPDLSPKCLQRLSADDKSPLARSKMTYGKLSLLIHTFYICFDIHCFNIHCFNIKSTVLIFTPMEMSSRPLYN